MHALCFSAADSTLDSGIGSTVYSDSHSSQQSVLYQSLLEPITMATQQVCIGSIHIRVKKCTVRFIKIYSKQSSLMNTSNTRSTHIFLDIWKRILLYFTYICILLVIPFIHPFNIFSEKFLFIIIPSVSHGF